MDLIRAKLTKILFLFVLQEFVCSTNCLSDLDFIDHEGSHPAPILKRDMKIPVGLHKNTLHHLTLLTATPLHEISSKISTKRAEIGLSPHIPLDQQDAFFQDFGWQTAQDILLKSPMPGKIIKVFVCSGQYVKVGEPLCMIEAMKMQHCIRAPSDGKITHVFLKEHTVIDNPNSALVALLPPSPAWENINQSQILDNRNRLTPFFPWAPVETPVAAHNHPLKNGEDTKDSVAKEESNPIGQTSQVDSSPLLPGEMNPKSQAISIAPNLLDPSLDNQSPLQEETKNLLAPTLFPEAMETFAPEIPLPSSQNNIIHEQSPASLPVLQVTAESDVTLQKGDMFTQSSSFISHDNDVLLENEFTTGLLLPRRSLRASYHGIVEGRSLGRSSHNDASGEGMKKEAVAAPLSTKIVIARSTERKQSSANNAFLSNATFFNLKLIERTSHERLEQPWQSKPHKKFLTDPPINPSLKSKLIIRNNHPVMKVDDKGDMSPSAGANWTWGLVLLGLIFFVLKTTLKPSSFPHLNGVDFNRYGFITRHFAHNLNSRPWPKGNSVQVPRLKKPYIRERKRRHI